MPASLQPSLFCLRDRVRIEGTTVTHLRTGRKVSLSRGEVSTLVRVSLKGIQEYAGETIDLSSMADPPVPGGRATAARTRFLHRCISSVYIFFVVAHLTDRTFEFLGQVPHLSTLPPRPAAMNG